MDSLVRNVGFESSNNPRFTKDVEKYESDWYLNKLRRLKNLDACIMGTVLKNSTIQHVSPKHEITIYCNKGWQTNLTSARWGATANRPPCLTYKCTNAIKTLLADLKTHRFSSSTIAIDAITQTQGLLMTESHVNAIIKTELNEIFVLEPTVNAPWFIDLSNFFKIHLAGLCKKVGLTYSGYGYGEQYVHSDLCRYKVAYDALHAFGIRSVKNEEQFKLNVVHTLLTMSDNCTTIKECT